MGIFLTFDVDLSPLAPSMTQAQAHIYIADIEARAVVEAPCIEEGTFKHADAVKAILRAAVLRRHDAKNGGVTTDQQSAGPFSQSHTFDPAVRSNGSLTKNEVRQLRDLCRRHQGIGSGRKAFTVAPK